MSPLLTPVSDDSAWYSIEMLQGLEKFLKPL
jgi:hypothetical protein